MVCQAASEEALGSMCIPETRFIYHFVVTECDLYILFILRNTLEVKIKNEREALPTSRDGLRHRLNSDEAPSEVERWGGVRASSAILSLLKT